jgi:hypothetical protein
MQDLALSRSDCFCTASSADPFISVCDGLIDFFVPGITQKTGFGQVKQDHIPPGIKV